MVEEVGDLSCENHFLCLLSATSLNLPHLQISISLKGRLDKVKKLILYLSQT